MRPTANLYLPPTKGCAIYVTKKGRYVAQRKRLESGCVLQKSSLHYSLEEARAWHDNLPSPWSNSCSFVTKTNEFFC